MWNWKQTSYNEWRLVGPGEIRHFAAYSELFNWCRAHGIDAKQV